MKLQGRKLWQVGAGDSERDYHRICLAFDVMIAGPGNEGPYAPGRYAGYGDIDNSLRRMCLEARQGDVVLLRIGTGRIHAVGVVADDEPGWSELFADVDGWNLQHYRRVRWLHGTAFNFPLTTLGTKVRTFASVNVAAVCEWVASLDVPDEELVRPLVALPDVRPILTDEELARRLYVEGLASKSVDTLVGRLASLRRTAAWYANSDKRPIDRPSEAETITYLVVPLLFALGWAEQTAAIEWHRVDIALFSRMPPTDATLDCVVEAKHLDRSVFSPFGQALAYALQPGRESCRRLIVTDGIRYAVHRREGDTFQLDAYLNLLLPCESYPVLGCGGAVKAILGMARGM